MQAILAFLVKFLSIFFPEEGFVVAAIGAIISLAIGLTVMGFIWAVAAHGVWVIRKYFRI